MELKLIYWIISWILIFGFCSIYLWSVLKRETKPHIYTMLLYVIITGFIFYSQVQAGAWLGSVYVGITFLFWCLIFMLSFWYGTEDIVFADKICLIFALLAIPLWHFTWSPLFSVILLMVIDIFSSFPTVRKTYNDPYSENIYTFIIEFIGIIFAILAISQINFISTWYLIYIMLFDVLMLYILLRWRMNKKKTD